MSKAEKLRVGVCILRIEADVDHVVITVTTNRNLDRNLYSARAEPPRRFTDLDAAIDEAAGFLRSFAHHPAP